MWITRVWHSPDAGGGGGGPSAPAPAATPAPTPAPAPAAAPSPAPAAPAPADGGVINDFRNNLSKLAQAGVKNMTRRLQIEASGEGEFTSPLLERTRESPALPSDLVDPSKGQPTAAPAPTPASEPAAPTAATDPNAPVPAKDPSAPAPAVTPSDATQPTEKMLVRAKDGKLYEFTHDQVANFISGYVHYDQQIQAIQTKMDQDRQAIAEERNAMASERQNFQRQLDSDDGLILRKLRDDENFKVGVLKLLDPSTQTQVQGIQQDQGIKGLQEQLAAVTKKLAEDDARRVAEARAFETRQQQQAEQALVSQVVTKIEDLNKQFRLPQRLVAGLFQEAHRLVTANQLPRDANAIGAWFQREMEAEANGFRKLQEADRGAYLQGKAGAPPPPPVNGGTPALAPRPLAPGRERIRAVADKLRAFQR